MPKRRIAVSDDERSGTRLKRFQPLDEFRLAASVEGCGRFIED
jgi:hypothetical protein